MSFINVMVLEVLCFGFIGMLQEQWAVGAVGCLLCCTGMA